VSSLTRAILAAAVAAVGGSPRAGQEAMADAVDRAFETGEHLLLQAGTGTGKSLGYLAPALAHLEEHPGSRVIIATATLALQAQLAHSDIPAAVAASREVTGRAVTHALLKGRTNYACLHRVIAGAAGEQDTLLGGEELAEGLRAARADAGSVVGAEVVALREWATGLSTVTTHRPTRRRRGRRSRSRSASAWAPRSAPSATCASSNDPAPRPGGPSSS